MFWVLVIPSALVCFWLKCFNVSGVSYIETNVICHNIAIERGYGKASDANHIVGEPTSTKKLHLQFRKRIRTVEGIFSPFTCWKNNICMESRPLLFLRRRELINNESLNLETRLIDSERGNYLLPFRINFYPNTRVTSFLLFRNVFLAFSEVKIPGGASVVRSTIFALHLK